MTPERLARRAAWELRKGDPALARRLLMQAAAAGKSADPIHAVEWLERALDVCLEYLPPQSDETRDTALALLDATGGDDSRAHKSLGVYGSLRAREAWSAGHREDAERRFEEAGKALAKAIALLPEDADAHATLGGLHRRAAAWYRSDEAKRRSHEDIALAAYTEGARDGSSPYAVLNSIEYGAVVRYNRALALRSATEVGAAHAAVPLPDAELFVGDAAAVRLSLERALFIREQQFRRHQDRPWPAFDLARGRHYLKPNVLKFLADLDLAIQDAREVARGESDAWMMQSAAQPLRELCGAGLPIDGLDDGLALLQRATYDERWSSGQFGAPLGAKDYLSDELAQVRSMLDALAVSTAHASDAGKRVTRFIEETKRRWSVEDEDRFQREMQLFLKGIEAPHKKILRVVWKMGGKVAAGLALEALVPGASAAKIMGAVAETLVEGALAVPGEEAT